MEKETHRFSVVVYSCSGAPRGIAEAVFVFRRGEHEFESGPLAPTTDGSLFWNERVTTTATLYRRDGGGFEEKEYTLSLHECATTKAGAVRRGAVFARGKLDLSLYTHAKTGKRVVLTLDPVGKASAALSTVLTVAAERVTAGEEVELSAPGTPRDEDEDAEHGEEAAPARSLDPPSDEEEEEAEAAPVAAARGTPKPLPPPPEPVHAKAVAWAGEGANAVTTSFRRLCACCRGDDDGDPLI